MKPLIQFIKMDRSESVENYVLHEVGKVHVWGTHDPHFKIWLECEKTKVDAGGPFFRTAIEVDGLKGHKALFVEKRDKDFYQCFARTIDALETIFRRDKGTLRNKQRKQLTRLKHEFFEQPENQEEYADEGSVRAI